MLSRLLAGLTTTLLTLVLWVPAIAQTPPAVAVSPDYRLGPGDVIRIFVFQNPDLSFQTQVSESGYVSYPLLGRIKIGGHPASRAEKRIADGLRDGKFVKQPHVSIVVSQVRGNLVSVLGHVNRAGRYPLASSNMRLTDILATAGGISGSGADTVTLVGSRGGRAYRKEIDLPSLFTPGGRRNDMVVVNGDVIWVDRRPIVFVYGEVQRPGSVALARRMTVIQALAASGGLTQRGTEKGLRIHRRDAKNKLQVIEPKMDDELRDGDVVYINESLF